LQEFSRNKKENGIVSLVTNFWKMKNWSNLQPHADGAFSLGPAEKRKGASGFLASHITHIE